MRTHPDVFGLYLWDVYNGKNAVQILERDDGHINANPDSTRLYFSSYDNWSESQRHALSYVHGKVLDIGCGKGDFLLELKKNFNLILHGLDKNTKRVGELQKKLDNIKLADAHDLPFDDNFFDLTISLFTIRSGLASPTETPLYIICLTFPDWTDSPILPSSISRRFK